MGWRRREEEHAADETLDEPTTEGTAELRLANAALREEISKRRNAERTLRGSESQLRLITDNVPGLIAYIDSEERYRFVNRRYRENRGLAPQEVIGRRVRDVLGDASYQKIRGSIDRALSGREASHVICLPLPDGRPNWLSSVYVPDRDPEGETRGFFALIQDVTELKLAEQNLREAHDLLEQRVNERTAELRAANDTLRREIAERRQAQEKLSQLSEKLEQRVEERTAELRASQEELLRQERLAALGQLTATVGHELRNPLAAMVPALYIIRLRTDSDDPKLDRALARIERGVSRCDRIIDELLDFTRIDKLDLRPIPIDEWLGTLLDELTIPASVTVRRELNLAGRTVLIDPDRFRRAFINVFENACQAMAPENREPSPEESSRLTVGTRIADRRLELAVADTGIGIPPDVLPKIFEPLYSTKGFGVGLGLPIVRQILEQHGGGIEIETAPGRGTRAVLWLPLPAGD